MPKTISKEELRSKLHAKIQGKKAGRMTNTQRKQKVNELYKKMGVSEADMKALSELTDTIKKSKQK
jgi:hypothetical protein